VSSPALHMHTRYVSCQQMLLNGISEAATIAKQWQGSGNDSLVGMAEQDRRRGGMGGMSRSPSDWRICGSVVISPSRVRGRAPAGRIWGRAPAENEFDVFYLSKNRLVEAKFSVFIDDYSDK